MESIPSEMKTTCSLPSTRYVTRIIGRLRAGTCAIFVVAQLAIIHHGVPRTSGTIDRAAQTGKNYSQKELLMIHLDRSNGKYASIAIIPLGKSVNGYLVVKVGQR